MYEIYGRPRPTAAAGRENSPGVWWHHKDDTENERRGIREINSIYSIGKKVNRKYHILFSYFYTQKKEQSPDILTQQISVDSDCANDGCVALSEHL